MSLRESLNSTTPGSKLTFNVFASNAEFKWVKPDGKPLRPTREGAGR